MSVLAVDWSGRRTGERRHLWTAEAADGVLLRLEAGRSRAEVIKELIARVHDDPGVVVGFDFSFSLPAWFLDEHGYGTARELWDAAAVHGEQWLRECAPPFWGLPGRSRPELAAPLRHTEARLAALGGTRPKSTFQIGGAGSVGTGSVRGFPALARLQDAGFAIWPFDAPAPAPVVVEIWPRTLTGPVVKSDPEARALYLDRHLPEVRMELRQLAVASEDAFDAGVSAVVMSRRDEELRALPSLTDVIARCEGHIWSPLETDRLRGAGDTNDQLVDCACCSRATDATIAGCRAAEMSPPAV